MRPRLGIQLDSDARGHGGRIVPLDRLPGLADDADRALALGRADLCGLLSADPGLAATRAGLDLLADPPGVRLDTPMRLLAPLHRPGKIICIGHNYRRHLEEQGRPLPEQPTLFAKFANAIVGDREAIVRPDVTDALDTEAELAVVIGSTAHRVPESLALEHVAGWTAVNDVSARDLQGQEPALTTGQRGDGQWVRAKSSDTFLPMGPAIVTLDELPDVGSLHVRSWRTAAAGTELAMQDGIASDMVFGIRHLIAYISHVVTLEPGDVIASGTPSGVGVWRNPPVYLEPGDVASVEVEGIGRIDNPVVAYDGTVPNWSAAAAVLVAAD